MASKYNKTIYKHGHRSFVWVVTGLNIGSQVDDEQVLGVFTDPDDAESKMERWEQTGDYVSLNCTPHDLLYPLAKSAKAGD
jgi:hypothetical protein